MSQFDLQGFLPFRLSRLAYEVSQRLAETYSDRFDIDIPEWRVLATLAARAPCTAQAIVASTRTHKSTISRAVNRLIENDWIERIPSNDDKREQLLQFSKAGKAKFSQLMPLVHGFENDIYSQLDKASIAQVNRSIDQLEQVLGLGHKNAK